MSSLSTPAQQQPDVVPRPPLIEQLAEHLHARDHRLLVRVEPDQRHFLLHLHDPALDAPRRHRPAPRDREHVLDRHQERLVDLPLRLRDVRVQRVHQLADLLPVLRVRILRLQRLQRRPLDDRRVVARGSCTRSSSSRTSSSTRSSSSGSSTMSTLFMNTTHVRHVHLPRQQDVLPRLRHRAVRRRHDEDRPVHLRRARDHVLHVVRVARAVHVRVVPLRRLVLHVRRRDRDPARLLLRRLVDLVERHLLRQPLRRLNRRDRRRQRRLPVIDVPDRPHVHMRLRPLELCLTHSQIRNAKGLDSQ